MPSLALAQVPSGVDLFVDSNILIYALTGVSAECLDFVRRFVEGEITAYASADVLSDVVHRLILADATATTGRLVAHRVLKRDPFLVRSLTRWQTKVADLLATPLIVDAVGLEDVRSLIAQIPVTGLLGKDALVYRSMASFGLTAIATNDADFERLDLTVYKPTDVMP